MVRGFQMRVVRVPSVFEGYAPDVSSPMIYISKARQDGGTASKACSVDDCECPTETRGLCSKHYRRWVRNGTTDLIRQPRDACSVDGCGRKHEAQGLCQSHYKRWQRHNDPMVRLTKGCAFAGCLARVAVGHYCAEHTEKALTGRRAVLRQGGFVPA
jgi:hypothetical protein